ncbi:MAG: FAD-dependent oxidoreductase, partial [Verrucomicrobiales bacterium]|nr:FAD-dependent oxidoreductase [Verrucomicrobiales bacterium]
AEEGAAIWDNVEVLNWKTDGENVEVETTQGRFSADQLVITAGAWAGQMLEECRIPFQILRKHLHWFEGDKTTDATAGFPLFFFEVADGFFYGFPKLDSSGVKVAEHSGGEVVVDPMVVDRTPDPEDSRRVDRFAQSYLRGVSRQRNRHSVCIYTMSPDGNFIVDRHPEFSNVAFAAGLSGHGFKFASVLGEVMADLALGEVIPDPLKFLSASRIVPC